MPSRISVLSILFDIGGDTESRISAVKTPLITYKLNNKSTTQTTFAGMFIDSISVRSFTSVLLLSPFRKRYDELQCFVIERRSNKQHQKSYVPNVS